jgi:gliding motility-associated-like protein
VQVRVVTFVTLNVRTDTTICLSDSVLLYASGNGLQYTWTQHPTIGNLNSPITAALPTGNTVYTVTARIGRCTTTGNLSVVTIPYPTANAGSDTIICFNSDAQLNASIIGSAFTWTPASTLNNPNILNPIASPNITTTYILSVTDALGCPKPKKDSIVVTVLPKIIPDAGNDTAVVVGQPLQFNATGGTDYLWSPGTGLSAVDIPDPIGQYDGSFDSIRYMVLVFDQAGCVDSAFIKVKVFKTEPIVFVPSAFTPNKDGKNDTFRPIAVGLTTIEYFRVFNRWGQLVFSTTTNGHGWDGKIRGVEQATGTFVWLVKGVDFTGKSVFQKGTVTLIK